MGIENSDGLFYHRPLEGRRQREGFPEGTVRRAVCLSHTAAFCFVFLAALPAAAQTKTDVWIAHFAASTAIPGAKRAGAQVCATCHAQEAKDFRHAFHAQQGVECEDCHGAGSLHVQGGGDVSKIIAFPNLSAQKANSVCLSCHVQDKSVRHWMAGPHAADGVRCTDCHQVHVVALASAQRRQSAYDTSTQGARTVSEVSPETHALIEPMQETNESCLRCHEDVRAQLTMPYHHPLREAKMSCVDCHDPHGGTAGNNLRAATVNQLCLQCHAQYRGPFAYQHPPVSENCAICHSPHGSPNTNILKVSQPALCLQCHAGHHNGAGLPITGRCTNCHSSIHGTDVPTPSGGSRFIDKGYNEAQLLHGAATLPGGSSSIAARPGTSVSSSAWRAGASLAPAAAAAGSASGLLAMMSAESAAPLSGGSRESGMGVPAGGEPAASTFAAFSFTPGAYRFIDATGFEGRVGEYDSLQQSAGMNLSATYVNPVNHLTVVSRANVLSGADYAAASQFTLGDWLQAQFSQRSFVQEQDHYPFYAFPVLDVPPGTTQPADTSSDSIAPVEQAGGAIFGVERRMGAAYVRAKLPSLPVHLFVKGDWQARVGSTQLSYLDENDNFAGCGTECHHSSRFQPVNYTTRDVGGGGEINWHSIDIVVQHDFSSFNDRLPYPAGTFHGDFDPSQDLGGFSTVQPPPSGPAPGYIPCGTADSPDCQYPIDIPSPSQASTDEVALNWTPSASLSFNGVVSYMRMRDMLTRYPQNIFDTDETVNWRAIRRLLVTLDYHQTNQLNDFTPYYSLFGNVSNHHHWEGLRLDYRWLKDFDLETYYRRSGITRSNAFLWPQAYSFDNTDLSYVVPSSLSNTIGLALRYHDRGLWSVRAGDEWTGTHDPGYLVVPQSNDRIFTEVTVTPIHWLTFDNDTSVIVQNDFRPAPLPHTPGASPDFGQGISGLPPDFQRRNRFYDETASFNLSLQTNWNASLGYSYQQNNLTTYMAFQNDASAGYVLDEPLVPYRQITQAYWAGSNYTLEGHFGLDFGLTYNSSRSGFRPDLNPADAALLGNQYLIASQQFDPLGFSAALANLQFVSTQLSQVIVPQWIGQSKAYYLFPYKIEGGLLFDYGSYKDDFNPSLNGVLRTFSFYLGRSW